MPNTRSNSKPALRPVLTPTILTHGLRVLLFAFLLSFGSGQAQAQRMGIVATVNNVPISQYDLQARLRLTMAFGGLPQTAETARQLAPKVIDTLIDEELKRQEAESLGIKVSDAMVASALRRFEQARKLDPGALDQMLNGLGISRDVLEQQVRADIGWAQAVRRRFRSRAQVSDEDIDAVIARENANKGKPVYLLSEIFLPVDSLREDAQTRELTRKILADLKRGTPFTVIAASFSQSPTAGVGGDLGWVSPSSLPPGAASALTAAEPGAIVGPISVSDGYYIYQLRNRQVSKGIDQNKGETVLLLQQLSIPIATPPTPQNKAAAKAQAATLRDRAVSCEAMAQMPTSEGKGITADRNEMKMRSLAPKIQDAISELADGQPSLPVEVPGAVMVFMICSRKTEKADDSIRDEIRKKLINERLGVSARQYLRDLKRNAFIERR